MNLYKNCINCKILECHDKDKSLLQTISCKHITNGKLVNAGACIVVIHGKKKKVVTDCEFHETEK